MSQSDGVSWPVAERIVKGWLGPSAKLDELSLLTGGVVNTTVAVRADGRRAVLKISQHRVNREYEREAADLRRLRILDIPVPEIYDSRTGSLEDPNSFLLIEYVEGTSLRELMKSGEASKLDSVQSDLLDIVTKLHSETDDTFGKIRGERFSNWPAFYRSLIAPVVEEANKIGHLPAKTTKVIHRVFDRLDDLVATDDKPRLLHGDLWGGNILCRKNEAGVWRIVAIIDPELRFGHAESELAYLDLFKTVTADFRKAYHQRFHVGDEYHRVRKPVYQLFALVNQYQLRGPDFAPPLIEAAEKVAWLV